MPASGQAIAIRVKRARTWVLRSQLYMSALATWNLPAGTVIHDVGVVNVLLDT